MAAQNRLGVLGGDNAGFPNGRRPGDDVVDAELRVAMGVLCTLSIGGCVPADAPAGSLKYTDGAFISSTFFANAFPYLRAPLKGSPNDNNAVKRAASYEQLNAYEALTPPSREALRAPAFVRP